MTTTLKAEARVAGSKINMLRSEGFTPAVVYGAGRETMPISISTKDFLKVWNAVGESGIVTLELPKEKVSVLIHEFTTNPVSDTPEHVDFLVVDISKPIEVSVPLEFVGASPAVKGGLGTLVKVMHEIEVRGLPTSIPHSIVIDISSLDVLDSNISVADLKVPSGVEFLAKSEDVVVAVAAIKEEKEEPAGPIDFTQIEVEKKGKKEEEGADDEAK